MLAETGQPGCEYVQLAPQSAYKLRARLADALYTAADDENRARHEGLRDEWFAMIRANLELTDRMANAS